MTGITIGPGENEYDLLFRDQRRQADEIRTAAFNAAVKSDPAKARAASRVAGEIGLPTDVVERNADDANVILARREFELAQVAEHSPILARQMVDPEFARQVPDDWKNLSIMERQSRGWETGRLTYERSSIGWRMVSGAVSADDYRRLAEIDARLAQIPPSEGIFANAAEFAGGMAGSFGRASVAAGAGALIGAAGGPAGPFTVPVGATIGFGVGMAADAAYSAQGSHYLDLINKGVDRSTAGWSSAAVGMVSGALNTVGVGVVTAPIRNRILAHVTEKVGEQLIRPTVGKAAGEFAKDYIKSVAGETVTEVGEEITQIISEGLNTGDWDGVGDRLAEVATKTAQGMVLLGLPGPTFGFVHDVRRARAAIQDRAAFARESAAAVESKLRTENPAEFQKFVEKVAPGDVFIEAEKVLDVFRQADKADAGEAVSSRSYAEQVDDLIPGLSGRLEEAARTGGDVTISRAEFHAKLSGTPIGKALEPHVRQDADALSPLEAENVLAAMPEMEKQAETQAVSDEQWDKEAQEIETKLGEQILAAGRGQSEARRGAKLARLMFETLAEGTGMTPGAAWQKWNVKVKGGELTGQPTKQDGRGEFNPADFTITLAKASALSKGADASTFVHELAHAWLTIYEQAAAQNLHPKLVDDFRTFLKWTGNEESAWAEMTPEQKRKAHENFAANFEAYLWEGKAPDPALRRLFAWFMSAMRNVYKAIRDTLNAQHRKDFGEDLLDLTPEIRGVFDRMIAAEDRVRVTQQIRGTVPAYLERADFPGTDAEWAKIQDEQRAADEAAVDDITRRSLADMRWLANAKGAKLRAIQAEAKKVRNEVRAKVAAEVQGRPVYRAMRWLKTGEMVGQDGTKQQGDRDTQHKVRTDMVPEPLRDSMRGMTSADGMAPDVVADVFGFDSGDAMVRELAAADIEATIEAETDAEMLRRHGKLVDPKQIDDAITMALHGEARRRFVASELRAMEGPRGAMRLTMGAAKLGALAAMDRRRVGAVSPRSIAAEARRVSEKAQRRQAEGDVQGAIEAKRQQLVLEQMVELASDVQEQVADLRRLFDGKHAGKADDALAKSRDIDYVNAVRNLGSVFSLFKEPTAQQRQQARVALERIRAERPDIFDRLQPILARWVVKDRPAANFRELTGAEFREVSEVANLLWDESRRAKVLDAEGKKLELDAAASELTGQVAKLPPRWAPGAQPPEGISPSDAQRDIMAGWHPLASLTRARHWARFMDGGADHGPFQRLLVAPLDRATTRYRAARDAMVQEVAGLLLAHQEATGAAWTARIEAKELGHTFRGKNELLDAMLHAGSQSGLEKLLVGYGWGEMVTLDDGTEVLDTRKWDRQVAEWGRNGTLTAADVAFLNKSWKLYAKLLPEAQKAHKALYGHEFETIETQPYETAVGKLDGGYVPARVDKDLADPQAIGAMTDEALHQAGFRLSVEKGFTLRRNPLYRQPLLLDLGRHVQSLDAELMFTHLQPALADARKLMNHREVAAAVDGFDRAARDRIVKPFLQNIALQSTTRPGTWKAIDTMANVVRRGASIAALGWNLVNALAQATGLSNARMVVPGKFLRAGARRFWTNPPAAIREAASKSEFMRQRFDQQTKMLREQIDRLDLGPIRKGMKAAQSVAGRLAFMPQRVIQSSVDHVVWHGAYQKAVADGAIEADAVERADNAVRLTQGSQNPEDMAAYEVTTPVGKLFTQFGSYGNLLFNQVFTQNGWANKAKAGLWVVMLPAIMEATIRTLIAGGPDDEDRDGTVDEWAAAWGKGIGRNVAGMFPVVGAMASGIIESEGSRVNSPVSTAITGWGRGLFETIEATAGDDVTANEAAAIATFFSMLLGVPLGAPARMVKQLASDNR